MRGNALLRYFLFVLFAVPISFLWLFPHVIQGMRVGYSADFQLLDKNSKMYCSRTATAKQRLQLHKHTKEARARIQRFWGSQRGRATLIYCPNQEEYETYCAGGEGAGCSIGVPWGTSYLVLGPDGNDTDVIAHELCHDELFARLGWWRVKRQIPQWYNEGLALMVDYRFSNPAVWEQPDSLEQTDLFADENIAPPFSYQPMLKLTDLETTRDFFGGDYSHTMLAYQTAADEVARWLSVVGRSGVPALATAVENGTDFNDSYRQLERARRKTKNPPPENRKGDGQIRRPKEQNTIGH